MKKLFIFILISGMGLISFTQTANDGKMPVTIGSKQALAFYIEALKCFDNVNLDKGHDLLVKSLEEDPHFFMANYQMALYCSWVANFEKFMEYAGIAVNCKTKLSEAEELLKSALKKFREDPNADVTEVGKKLVEMYPRDINAYNNLFYFQSFINDFNGELETLEKELKIADNKASIYNQLGYVYMSLKKNYEAEAAFDKYIEMDPKNPNVYDSKGDFFIYMKDFKKAYESYMKAYSMDTSFSYEKARKAKQLYESQEGKKIDIIPL
jgi:tetratricopeptide (TPR) repeat protein